MQRLSKWQRCSGCIESRERRELSNLIKSEKTLDAIRPETQKLSFNVVRVYCWNNADQLLS